MDGVETQVLRSDSLSSNPGPTTLLHGLGNNDLISLCLSFLTCNMRIVTVLAPLNYWKDYMK